ncbi:hypothetical protein L6452_38265 [Arctium lappa]|uniref:Uncharacterized protein n=1 Tax=Arctium lappa TaxID=4217 RepID=A0ACB8Y5W6_ARCLA|nr:hypothetical protein L6452_38265 [Arctium lappa]
MQGHHHLVAVSLNQGKYLALWIIAFGFVAVHVYRCIDVVHQERIEEVLVSMCDQRARMLQDQFSVSVNYVHALAVLVSTFHYYKNPSVIDQWLFVHGFSRVFGNVKTAVESWKAFCVFCTYLGLNLLRVMWCAGAFDEDNMERVDVDIKLGSASPPLLHFPQHTKSLVNWIFPNSTSSCSSFPPSPISIGFLPLLPFFDQSPQFPLQSSRNCIANLSYFDPQLVNSLHSPFCPIFVLQCLEVELKLLIC